jgi:hypothetical protein
MAARSDEPDFNVEYFQVLEDGMGLHAYGELPLMWEENRARRV